MLLASDRKLTNIISRWQLVHSVSAVETIKVSICARKTSLNWLVFKMAVADAENQFPLHLYQHESSLGGGQFGTVDV